MYEIIRLFFDICLFRKGPEDVPHSLMLLQLSIVAYAVIGFLISIATRKMKRISRLLIFTKNFKKITEGLI